MQISETCHQIFWFKNLGYGPEICLFVTHSRSGCGSLSRWERNGNRLYALSSMINVFAYLILFYYSIFTPIFPASRLITDTSYVLNKYFWLNEALVELTISWRNVDYTGDCYTIYHDSGMRVPSYKKIFNCGCLVREAFSEEEILKLPPKNK